ncbi:hypothetical protein A9Q83_10370 [Alphaproteobacteria bacterium 46_93_T64]|nr:hypothetical protein A9Q83_10370 [Alphaproteobacteria bacterium 46_93_T64]
MLLQNIDLNLFVVFEVIYDTGNLTQTAQTLNKTQPAVSNSLARLRDTVGDPLFVHAGKRMNPTARADELIGPVRQALRLFQSNMNQDYIFDPLEVRKTLRLSIGDIGETIILPKFVNILRAEAPNITLQVFQVQRRSIASKLAANEIDFAVDIPMPTEGELRHTLLMSDRQVCALSNEHKFAKKSKLSLEDYLSCDHIHVSYRRKGGGVVDIGLGKIGASRNKVVRLQHHQAAFALLNQTDLMLSAPSTLANLYNCRVFELPFEAPNLDLHLYWHGSAERSALNRWVRQKLKEATSELGPVE